ncbi:hypothetical protein RyT2_01830 [Pseudolactococcus yaeyamensis]
MDKDIFRNTADSIVTKLISDIKSYKKVNNLHLYELLYSKDNQRIINDSNGIGEPYYSFSKRTSTETMSRIINSKGKITDEVAKLIAENMGIPYSTLVWGVHEKGMNQHYFRSHYNFFWDDVFYDALLSSKYKFKVIELFKDYIPFSKFIVKNEVRLIDDKSELEKLFNTDEFRQIIVDATRRFLLLADASMRLENISVWQLYTQYFISRDNTLKNLSKTIDSFFSFCYEEYFQFVIDAQGSNYGLEAYNLLEECVEMTLVEYEMENPNNWNGVNLLEERSDEMKEEWILKKELVIDTYNFVDRLANYQKRIEEITLKSEWEY